ncbi:MAG TPA: protein kinase, partial [Streptosporangiaceae bacterium]|nr:protein kinase [Streptosporangiaceae bacterium]
VKPANIVVADDKSIFLVDFGIAKIVGEIGLTGQSRIVGTTEFIAPERLEGDQVTPAADLWSLGVTFFLALEGYSPFLRPGPRRPEATIAAILRDDPPRLKRADRMADIVLSLLNKIPEARPSAAEVIRELQPIVDGHPARRRYPDSKQATTKQLEPARSIEPPPHQVSQTRAFSAIGDSAVADIRVNATESASKLLSMSQERAARTIAGYSPKAAAEVIDLIYATQPATAEAIFQMISSKSAGRTINHLDSRAAAAILNRVPARKAIRILSCADARAAGAVVMELPNTTAIGLLKEMDDAEAATILGHVEPATVAALLSSMDGSSRFLLTQLTPSFRRQVLRHLNS